MKQQVKESQNELSRKLPFNLSNKRKPKQNIMPSDTILELTTIAEVLLEKYESLSSKVRDETATEADKHNLEFAQEVIALAKNRVSALHNEKARNEGKEVWVERTSESHNPHIRLHGGVREDDVPK